MHNIYAHCIYLYIRFIHIIYVSVYLYIKVGGIEIYFKNDEILH